MLAGLRWGERRKLSGTLTTRAEGRIPGTPHAGPREPYNREMEHQMPKSKSTRKQRLRNMQPKGHPTGPIGRPGEYQRRQLGSVLKDGRVLSFHATKGWRNRRA